MATSSDLDGRTFLVTGANTGIGRATADGLAERGARLILATRSAERTRPVIDSIRSATGNDAVEHHPLDLSDLGAVRRSAAELLERGEPIDVLIANAGLAGQRGLTVDGFELAFGTNHLGHFLFVTEVLPLLRAGTDPRVVVVASDSHYDAKGLPEDVLRRSTRTITGLREYERSKLANVVFAQELARREAGTMAVHVLHPGVIASDIWRKVPWPVRPIMTSRMLSVEDGARTSLWCATSTDVAGETGGYYADCAAKDPSTLATPELGAWLWERSEAWTAASG